MDINTFHALLRITMQRLSDYWTLTAVRVRQFEDGTVEWDHSVDGHWPY